MADGTKPPRARAELSPPPDFRSATLDEDGRSILVMSYELPEWELPAVLTESERNVLRRVLNGASHAAVAETRGVSGTTIANQLASIFSKLGARSRMELAARLRRASRGELGRK